jgi:hypothetical protein
MGKNMNTGTRRLDEIVGGLRKDEWESFLMDNNAQSMFLSFIPRIGADYCVIGSAAGRIYGGKRDATPDMDFLCLSSSKPSIRNIALSSGLKIFLDMDFQIRFGLPDITFYFDFLLASPHGFYQTAIAEAISVPVFGVSVQLIKPKWLLALWCQSSRNKHLLDGAHLIKSGYVSQRDIAELHVDIEEDSHRLNTMLKLAKALV